MSSLLTEPRLARADDLFEALVEAHRDLDEAASARLHARLVFVLANHIGDEAIVLEALGLARAAALE